MEEKIKIKILFAASLLLVIVGIWHIWPQEDIDNVAHIEEQRHSGEIEKIKASGNLNEQVQWYTDLIDRVGPIEAQELLYRSGLPFTGETHILNHVVGDKIYEKYGEQGLVYCRDYFLSSCYHGFLIRLIGEGGMEAVAGAVEECKGVSWPVYVQCAHAIGHGFLAETGYKDLPGALDMCSEVKRLESDFPEFNCHDGVFMENVWAVHEGAPSPDRWVDNNDPLYPCNDERIDEKYLKGCWSNQSAVMYRIYDGDIAKIGKECAGVEKPEFKEQCFNGLARQIHPVAGDNIDKTFDMCALMPENRENYCLSIVASADFSVGGRELPFGICNRMYTENRGDSCYRELVDTLKIYESNKKQRTELCAKIKDPAWRDKCLD